VFAGVVDFMFHWDVCRIGRVVEEADNSDHKELSDGGCKRWCCVVAVICLFFGEVESQLFFCFFMFRKQQGGNVYRICYGRYTAECHLITINQSGSQ